MTTARVELLKLLAEQTRRAWDEYDTLAEKLAAGPKRRLDGADPLPAGVSHRVAELVADDPEAFEQRIRAFAYALAMDGVFPEEVEPEETEPTRVDACTSADIVEAFKTERGAFAWPDDAQPGDLPDGSNFYTKRVRS